MYIQPYPDAYSTPPLSNMYYIINLNCLICYIIKILVRNILKVHPTLPAHMQNTNVYYIKSRRIYIKLLSFLWVFCLRLRLLLNLESIPDVYSSVI